MHDHKLNTEIKIGSERNFGLVFATVFLLVGLWPLLGGEAPRWLVVVIGLVLAAIAFLAPQILKVPNKLWFKFGLLLGAIVAPVIMALVYFLAFVPIGLIIRGTGKDLLSTELAPEEDSYWIKRDRQPNSLTLQY